MVRLTGWTSCSAPGALRGTDFATPARGGRRAPDGGGSGPNAGRSRSRLRAHPARPAGDELIPFGAALAAESCRCSKARAAADPRPAVVCSVRDILQSPSRRSARRNAAERLCAFYDRVLVHGDPEVVPLDATWLSGDELERRLA